MKRSSCRRLVFLGLGMALTLACGPKPASSPTGGTAVPEAGSNGAVGQPSALQLRLAAMNPARAGVPSDNQKRLGAAIDSHFQRVGSRRYYVHVDKPLYQPGEAIWFRIWELTTPTLASSGAGHGLGVELVSPKGATVLQKRVRVQAGVASNDFELPGSVQGGEYTLRVTSDMGGTAERKLIVSTYQPPRIKKKVEFLRKAYGPGDEVAAALSLARATGEALAKKQVTALVVVDQSELERKPVTTDSAGNAIVKFTLPGKMTLGDGLLTILVSDGGVTESVQKRIPITLKEIQLELFPEGGQLVSGLPGRVYFSAKNLIGKPADVDGRVVDGNGQKVAAFTSLHNGLGRFEITPRAGQTYFAEITRPVGIAQRVPLPVSLDAGCVMQAVDDFASAQSSVRVGVWCSQPRAVIATAVLREKRLGDISVAAQPAEPTVVDFPVPPGSQGAIRVTLFDEDLNPLAERLLYHGRGNDLKVAVKADRKSFSPRDKVSLTVETVDLAGKPVEADLSLAVVDDTVLSFADDKSAHVLARLYLESEMPGQEIEEPNFYFSGKPKAAPALDLVLGTQGWRRFEWRPVLDPPDPAAVTYTKRTVYDFEDDMIEGDLIKPDANMVGLKGAPEPPPPPVARPAKRPAPGKAVAGLAQPKPVEQEILARRPRPRDFRAKLEEMPRGEAVAGEDLDWAGKEELDGRRWAWAPVRVFPAPTYAGRYDGPRVDFRETIYWQPSVKTDAQGRAKVEFYLSDAITSFRVTAEGVSKGGLPGRAESLVESKLPVSLAVKMPLEVSKGDTVRLPVTLSNETDFAYDVAVVSSFGPAFTVTGGIPARVSLKAGERKSFFASLKVVGSGKKAEDGAAVIGIDTANLKDEVARTIKVVPLGFPQEVSLAGTLEKKQRHEIDLAGALPGTIEATVTMYPSPLATMVRGTEAIIREPSGCFEQASSANYPNIMVLGYLEEHDSADPALVQRAFGMLERGYAKIAGYESPKRGYEWFGGDPGHEALTAYGLMEFADMSKVYPDVDTTMIERTQTWLKSRRDGKGGYQRNARALDSFGRASAAVTNGYITYALSEAGAQDLGKELKLQKQVAGSTKDPYLMAMAANSMLNIEPSTATTAEAVDKLAKLQGPDGSFKGADHSITRSGGMALDIETTALATMAMLKAGDAYAAPARKAVDWLNQNRGGYGGFGSTQSTILSLKAMTEYAQATRKTQSSGKAIVLVNGKRAGEIAFDKGHKQALVFDDLAAALRAGKNRVEIQLESENPLPYSIAISYRSKLPATSPNAAVAVAAMLAKDKVQMGESVRMNVSIKNLTDDGIPMTLARVGLPGGLTYQTWQLKELRDKKLIDFYETREREVILYFRSMPPKELKEIALDLMARVPGDYVAPASRAYLYYTDEYKHWAEPVRITVNQ